MATIKKFVKDSLSEDLGRGDLFGKCVHPKIKEAVVKAKDDGIFAGEIYGKELLKLTKVKATFNKKDGDSFKKGEILIELKAEDTTLLAIERTLLNTLQHASGIATLTNSYTKKLKKSKIKLLDTRKTRPLLRHLEKYATAIGGATNHRMGLDDCLMIKDTHLGTIEDLGKFVEEARKNIPMTAPIEVECENTITAKKALKAGVEVIMCDNMDLKTIEEVIKLRDKHSPKTKIEVSGNITIGTLEKYVDLKIDYISTGSIIHQATWLDLSMKMKEN
ncbi:MAG: carboxylating nicotinate-nucleotide diphosphorylase [Campylobacterales bacterium]|nr:carboxylating nicotinate-nucleotide diphosphorylase [Campylobacterales bacterium]